MKNNNKGFSLVELIVVIAIMAVLVGVLAPTLLRYVEKSRQQKDESAVAEVINAVKLAMADEKVAAEIAADDSVVITNGTITVTTASTGTEYLNQEVQASVATKPVFTSKAHQNQKYTITFEVTSGTDATIKQPEYNANNWSAVSSGT